LNWLKYSSGDVYDVVLNGRKRQLTEEQIAQIIKKSLKNSLPVKKLFNQFDVDINQLDNLNIKLVPLKGRYALTDHKEMRLNKNLFREGDFFDKYMFVILHEIVHFVSRMKEKKSYFSDPEESLAFIVAIAHELSKGRSTQEIWKKIYPKIEWHFHNEDDAERFFRNMLRKAKNFL